MGTTKLDNLQLESQKKAEKKEKAKEILGLSTIEVPAEYV